MRDPWFPVALILIVLITVWLGILGPLPDGILSFLQKWQTLLGALVAIIAAYIAFENTSRSLRHSEDLERRRRSRKHAAVRAVLPLALSQISNYAAKSARALAEIVQKCSDEKLAPMSVPEDLVQPLTSETLKTLTEFIEFSDSVDVRLIESTVARIQIHDSRLRDLVTENRNPNSYQITIRTEIEGYIVDAAAIYAGAAAVYEYARREQKFLTHTITWENVRSALRDMHFWVDEYPRLEETVRRRERLKTGPFEPSKSILDFKPSEIE